MSLEKLQRCHRCSSIAAFVYNDWQRNLSCTPRQSAITADTHATMFIYYCVACQLEGSNFLHERRGCEWKAVPQLSWMEVDARGYWVCPGCARLVNRDVNREYRAMPVTGIQSIVWHTADLDQVSDDVRWEKFPKADQSNYYSHTAINDGGSRGGWKGCSDDEPLGNSWCSNGWENGDWKKDWDNKDWDKWNNEGGTTREEMPCGFALSRAMWLGESSQDNSAASPAVPYVGASVWESISSGKTESAKLIVPTNCRTEPRRSTRSSSAAQHAWWEMAFITLHLSSRIAYANCKLCNLYNLASVEIDGHYYCVACQREGSNFLPERRGCEWKAVPQLSWMEVNARDYWVCPGCARLVNRDVNREYRGMPVTGIQPISRQPTDLDRVSDDAWWKVAFTTLRLSSRIHYANWYVNSDAFGYTNWTPT